jgi:hypothetical protein
MREIKFRFYDQVKKHYALKSDFYVRDGWVTFETTKYAGYSGKDIVIEQYIGMFDKYGNEMYEGDVVFCDNTKITHVVEYKQCEGSEGVLIMGYEFETGYQSNIRIIGNVHSTHKE